ncbi:hypothetical protein CK203_104587 [Vitis vinifera]|uniref:Uncharacterized protein n=1 Tax=Vitis vinifera TaxID=29760 RepID=A0A438D3I9_VITVI|nr:hypothetical protein CK203_104587 [Vitis vinifera]
MEEISMQTLRREIEPTARGKDMEKGMRDLKEQMQDLREGMLVSQAMARQEASRVEVPKPQGFSGKRDAKELDNFLWHIEVGRQELRHRGVQDLAIVMAVAKCLMNYKIGDSSKVESLEDSHATGRGDRVSKDHNAPRMGSTKTPNVREGRAWYCPKRKALTAMIEERGQKDEAHIGSMQLLGSLQVNPKPSTPKISLLSRVQVNEAKESELRCLEKVLETYREVSRRGNNRDIDDIGGGECHKMLQMTLPMGLYRMWEASRDPWRHLNLATNWKSMETSRED